MSGIRGLIFDRADIAFMNILITGADGFIGSHLTEELVRQGHKVKAFVLYNSFGSWGWLDRCAHDVKGQFEVFAGDIRDPHGVKEAMKGCDAVLHLAALIAIPYSYHSPDTYVDTNVKGTFCHNIARGLCVGQILYCQKMWCYSTGIGLWHLYPGTQLHTTGATLLISPPMNLDCI